MQVSVGKKIKLMMVMIIELMWHAGTFLNVEILEAWNKHFTSWRVSLSHFCILSLCQGR